MPEQSKEGPPKPNRKTRRAANAQKPEPAPPKPAAGKLTLTYEQPGKTPLVASFDGITDVTSLGQAIGEARTSLFTQLMNQGMKG